MRNVNVRVDQARKKEPTGAVDALGLPWQPSLMLPPHVLDPAVAYDDDCIAHRFRPRAVNQRRPGDGCGPVSLSAHFVLLRSQRSALLPPSAWYDVSGCDSMSTMTELAQLTWAEAKEAIEASPVSLLPVGSIEQHGPHLPLATDLLIAQHLAARAAEKSRRLLLPPLPVGISHEHSQFWGTLTLSADGLADLALAIVRSAAAHGLKRFVFVNGHGANCVALDDAARQLRGENLPTYVFNWWQAVGPALRSLSLSPVDHAGPVETSILLAINPSLVRTNRLSDAARAGEWGRSVESVQVLFDAVSFTPEGNVGDPRSATAEKGTILLRDAIAALNRFCDWLADRPDGDLVPHGHVA